MVLRPPPLRLVAPVVVASAFAVLLAAPLPAADAPRPGEVTLPLGEYLSLVDQAAAAARARELRAQAAPAHAEVVAQRATVRVGEREAEVAVELEVEVAGHPAQPVALPFAGFPTTAAILVDGRPLAAAAVRAAAGGAVQLVPPVPGHYTVRLEGRAPITAEAGVGRLALPAVAAPIAVADVDLAADAAWSAPGAVVAEDQVQGARRHLRLAGKRGETQALELRRHVDSVEAEKLLARTVLLTLVELRPEGPRRHDVVLYEVSRGALASMTVELPPGLELGAVASDEGEAVPVVEGSQVTVHRRRQLQGSGYLVLTSAPASATMPLAPPKPELEVRARYFALASSIAAEARPQPEAAWSQVDLDDLPPLLREGLQVIDLLAAWRAVGEAPDARLRVVELPAAPRVEATVERRETTTLLTVDGTLLHRDRFVLATAPAIGSVLELTLPPGATLWSAKVGEQPVRPLQRGAGIAIPLGFGEGPRTVVEVVCVQPQAIPRGRSVLALELAQVALPVLDHRWRLLLPEEARYRYRDGDLRPASEPVGTGAAYYDMDDFRVSSSELEKTPTVTDRTNGPLSAGPGGNAAVVGKVVDDHGESLPGVTVTLGSLALGQPLVQVSNSQGFFRFIGLPAGNYQAKAEIEGFSSVDYPRVVVTDGRITQLDLTLSAAVEEAITVTAEAPLLDERRLSTGATISGAELDSGGGSGGGGDVGRSWRRREEAARAAGTGNKAQYAAGARDLQQGLVGGVKPLPIVIPEGGKALLLTGVLPPARVAVELEVRAKR
ncbi:MAG TPA: carboxypeptidase-like regulatory domain-containing protein [Thermoanaerobaculia bacterium]|nr:carboxypeptidase-like regulatory domain-containing protein [Thermoanaerobaculia bacterium]